ncbi:ATP-binding protein [Desulfonatronospira sp.]|uniref:Lon protease family protein n=1 Tax=Desulfonatronospira sp. TaxID=1962951 RepID=UPI0025BF68CF|nr:ATP-binding protein [Desulfonatronospira sp.]
MTKKHMVPASRLCVRLASSKIPFSHTGGTAARRHKEQVFQQRAFDAMELAVSIKRPGYNVYLSGEQGLGRNQFILDFLGPRAAKMPTPGDWIYVNNLQDPDNPLAISLPPGSARDFRRELQTAVKKIRESIPAGFEQDFYIRKHGDLIKEYNETRENLLSRMEHKAHKSGFSLSVDENGSLSLYPLVEGKAMDPEEFEKLGPEVKKDLMQQSNRIMEALLGLSRQISRKEQDLKENERKLDQEVAGSRIDACLKKIRQKYADYPRLMEYMDNIKQDLLENVEHFKPREQPSEGSVEQQSAGQDVCLSRYGVNILVEHSPHKGAPVLVEDNPNYFNLLGCIERETEMGAYYTDFTLIKAGSLHKANGGFLIIRAEDILSQPQAWEGLLRCLRSGRAEIDDPADQYEMVRTRTIRPETIGLDIKIILLGSDEMYELLLEADERFGKLFKIKAHLRESISRTPATIKNHSLVLAGIARNNSLSHFTREAVAALVDHSSRLAGDQQKLSLKYSHLADLMMEADAFARINGGDKVEADSVYRALEARKYRLNLYEDEFLSEYEREAIRVQTKGYAVGRANGLSVSMYGDYILALPHQISCTTGVGHGGIMDLEREAELGGPIHTKGMMIIKGYLQNLFAQDKPLVLSGSLCFEQSYAHIDGDSASGAELAALLSALSGVPINLSHAFTGAISQSGAVMAVGEVTRKIEGYFELCRRKGLTGEQGVIIPRDNLAHLMLSEEVIQAVRQNMFHVHAVLHIEEAMEILTGVRAGKKLTNGKFSPGSIYRLADESLQHLAHLADKKVPGKRRKK